MILPTLLIQVRLISGPSVVLPGYWSLGTPVLAENRLYRSSQVDAILTTPNTVRCTIQVYNSQSKRHIITCPISWNIGGVLEVVRGPTLGKVSEMAGCPCPCSAEAPNFATTCALPLQGLQSGKLRTSCPQLQPCR